MTSWTDGRWARLLESLLLIAGLLGSSVNVLADTVTRTSAFEYDPVSGLLTKEIIEPNSSDLCLVTEYTYDTYGNKLTATTRNCNGSAGTNPGVNSEATAPASGSDAIIASRTVSTTYDAQGRFPISNTNALNQTETKVFDGRFGVLTNLTGPNGLVTAWAYDDFGRKLTESRADGTTSQTVYALCDVTCPTNAKYKITASQAGSPTGTVYYDMFGRAIQTDNQDKDGATIYSRTDYDHLGRVDRASRPAKVGEALAWSTITYDTLNRPINTVMPDGSQTTVTYNGLVTITKNALNQTRTEHTNSQGQTIAVTNAYSKVLNYQYDAFGNLIKTIDSVGNITTITYDVRGRKIAMNDPDQGILSYTYDALGQLKRQTDAKAQVTAFQYDKLGRMTQRHEPDLISTWIYDTCDVTLNPSGKCTGKPVKESSDNGYIRTYLYDSYGRMTAELDNVDQGYGVAKAFDSYGRVASLVYPTGFTVNNIYSLTGYLVEVRNASTGGLYWRADTTDATGNVTQETLGNGVVTNRNYNANTGRLSQITIGTSGNISDQNFVYDSIGNLVQRYEGATGLNESFGYDNLNRLTATTAVSGSNTTSVTVSYDDIGNIISKSDVGTYTYGTSVNGVLTRPHAVASITMMDGVTNYATYSYDANGNMTSGKGRTIGWNSWNMPTSIIKNGKTYGFVYNSSHERVKQTTPTQTIYNISPRLDTGIHVEKRIKTSDGSIEYVHSLYAGLMPFGTVTTTAAGVVAKTRYLHADHLGSIVAITDEAGTVLERRSYDAWGKRRNLNGTPSNSIMQNIEDRHGFTGHEELEEVGIIHMNGRMYDPETGRFLSADPTIQMPDDMQNYNRYSYINNNPLSAVDYSGYGFLSKIFKGVKKLFKKIGREIERGVTRALRNPVLRMVGQVTAAVLGGPPGAAAFAAASSYANTGSLTSAFKDGLIAYATGRIFNMVGTSFPGAVENTLAHAIVGCVSSVAQEGECGSGAIAGGFSAAVANAGLIQSDWHQSWQITASAVVGGTASVLGGGKFENGAITGAFGYIFNCMQHPAGCGRDNEIKLGSPIETVCPECYVAGGVIGAYKHGVTVGKWVIKNSHNIADALDLLNTFGGGVFSREYPASRPQYQSPTSQRIDEGPFRDLGTQYNQEKQNAFDDYKRTSPRKPYIIRIK